MKTGNLRLLIALGILGTLLVIGLCSLHGSFNDFSVIIDGEQMTGAPAAGYAFGGMVIALLVAVLAMVLVGLVLAGVSIFVIVLLAAVFFTLVLLLSPLLLPLLLVVGLIMFCNRKKSPQMKQIN